MGFLSLFTCWRRPRRQSNQGKPRRKSRHASRRARQSGGHPTLSLRVRTSATPLASPRMSVMTEEEFFDAQEEVTTPDSLGRSSLGDGYHSVSGSDSDAEPPTPPQAGLLDRLKLWFADPGADIVVAAVVVEEEAVAGGAGPLAPSGEASASAPAGGGEGGDGAADESDLLTPESPSKAVAGCVSLFSASQAGATSKRFRRSFRPSAGASLQRRQAEAEGTACLQWQPADPRTFQVRSLHYMKTKQKEPCAGEFYRPVGVDFYSFDVKLSHIAKHIQLPTPPTLGPGALALPPNERLPPLLVINLQLPTYTPSIFSANDGPGHSLVFYFALPEGWEPSQEGNAAALAMVQRFIHGGTEFDGQPTRDRLKLIGRVVNVDEWAKEGPLSGYEHRLLLNYNDKPLLTRPQHRFYSGPSYFEVDVDIHGYAYLARKALHLFISRLAPVVFENAFLLQGNRPEELPEVLLGAARVFRVDFTRAYPFPAQ